MGGARACFYKLGGSDSLDVKQYITEYLLDPGGRILKTFSKKEALYIDSVCGTQVFYLFVLCSHNNISLLQRGITTFVGTRTADDV